MALLDHTKATWWRHQMETFFALVAICEENPPISTGFPSPVTRSFDVFFDLHLNKRLSKQLNAHDLNCHHAPYDTIVMMLNQAQIN